MVITPHHPSFFQNDGGVNFDESHFIFSLLHKIALRRFVRLSSHGESIGFEMALAILEKQISKGSKPAAVITETELYAGYFIFEKLLQADTGSVAWQARNVLPAKHQMALAVPKIS